MTLRHRRPQTSVVRWVELLYTKHPIRHLAAGKLDDVVDAAELRNISFGEKCNCTAGATGTTGTTCTSTVATGTTGMHDRCVSAVPLLALR